jgi:hypothetical protein
MIHSLIDKKTYLIDSNHSFQNTSDIYFRSIKRDYADICMNVL